jgi:uncharacterized protein
MKAFRRAHLKVSLPFLAALLAFFPFALSAQRVQDLPAKPADYVSDFAHVLSPETIARIDAICSQLDHSAANAQIAVVTVHTLAGEDAAEYADELETKWKMGRKGSDRGVLILLAVDDHQRRIEVGYGLEGILNDAKLGDIGRAMVPYLRANDFDSAVMLAVDRIAQEIAADAHVTLDENTPVSPAADQPVRHHSSALAKLILLIIVLLFFGGFSLLRMLFGFGLFFGGWGGGGWRGGGWGNGGGFGGGGGDSGGGGFGGFGGGSFGGGGAGGSW